MSGLTLEEFRRQYSPDAAHQRLTEAAVRVPIEREVFRRLRTRRTKHWREGRDVPVDFGELPEFMRQRAVEKGMAW
jgi:hypothetical protein